MPIFAFIVIKYMAQIYISKELKEKLELVRNNSEIAKLLLKGDLNSETLVDDYVNYLSIDLEDPTKISYLNKERFNIIKSKGEDVWLSSKRYNVKPGGLIGRLFKSTSNKEVENFAALMKAALNAPKFKFNIVEGEEMRKWYFYESYSELDKGSLGASCLRHSHSQGLLDFYVQNPKVIKMLLMLNTEGKLLGRAILWYLKGQPHNFIMDRIYTINSDDEFFFKQWADSNSFIYKSKQNWNTPYIFESNGEIKKAKMSFSYDSIGLKIGSKYMPYFDTFKWIDIKNWVFFNYKPDNIENVRTFVTTNGTSYPANHLALDELDEHYWQQDEIVNCEYLKLRTKNINTNWSDICHKYILVKDSVFDEELSDYIFNSEFNFLNPIEKINSIKEKRRILLEKKKLEISKLKLDSVQKMHSVIMEYYRTGEININDLTEQIQPHNEEPIEGETPSIAAIDPYTNHFSLDDFRVEPFTFRTETTKISSRRRVSPKRIADDGTIDFGTIDPDDEA